MCTGHWAGAQWERLRPLLPRQKARRGRPPKEHRQIINGFLWLDRTGAPWRDLPAEYGPWQTVATLFYRWRRAGAWDRILASLQQQADAEGKPNRVAGDKGYSSKKLRRYLRRRGIGVVIARQTRERRVRFDQAASRKRNVVERLINRLKQFRRIATRYGKRAVSYLAMLTIAGIVLLL